MSTPVSLGESFVVGLDHVVVRTVLHSGEKCSASFLVAMDDGTPALLWLGQADWGRRVLETLQGCDGVAGVPRILGAEVSAGNAALLLSAPPSGAMSFDESSWQELDSLTAVEALHELAHMVGALHRQGSTLRGMRLSELFFDAVSGQFFIVAMPRLCKLERQKPEVIWRDLRLFGELAFGNTMQRACPDGHAMVALLQDRRAMIETGLTHAGLNQVLAGCVTPYGDLAYLDVDDLLTGLGSLRAELVRPLGLQIGSSSTVGSYIFRHNNQDSCGHVVLDSQCGSRKLRSGFFCVADGIGGIEDGEHASRLAVESAATAFVRAWSFYGAERLEKAAVSFARGVANVVSQRLVLEGEFARQNNRGGTTFTGLLIAGGRVGVCHVGDSRAVLVRGQQCIALTEDHSLARILIRLGDLTEEEARKDKMSQRTISRFMSTSNEVEDERIAGFGEGLAARFGVDEEEFNTVGLEIRPGDLFLITSDGAHDEFDREWLLEQVNRFRGEPQQLCEAITRNAIERIGRDNATALAILVEG